MSDFMHCWHNNIHDNEGNNNKFIVKLEFLIGIVVQFDWDALLY